MLSILTIRKFQPILLAIAAMLVLPGLRFVRAADEQPAAAKPADNAPNMFRQDAPGAAALLVAAMQNNPDILVGQSEVYEAEAELNRVEFDVVRKVVAAKSALQAQQLEVEFTVRLHESKAVSPGEVRIAKGKLIPLEADLKYLVGMRTDPPAKEKGAADHVEGENKPADGATAKPAVDQGTDIHVPPGVGNRVSVPAMGPAPIAVDFAIAANTGIDVLVARALANNPDILLAKAKLSGTQAELNRTRLDVARRVIMLKESLNHLNARVDALRQSVKMGTSEEAPLLDAIADLAAAQAELEYVLGRPSWADLQKIIQQSSRKPDKE